MENEVYTNCLHIPFQDLSCNPTAEVKSCPKGSNCIDNGTSDSFCVCSSNFTVNSNFSVDKNSYCVEKIEHPSPIAVTSTSTTTTTTEKIVTAAKTTEATTKATTTTESAKIQPTKGPVAQTTTSVIPEQNEVAAVEIPHHHILGGIFLPIFIVLAFIAGVFAVKKYDLLDRAHRYIRNRNQNQYNGLMENDFDDDACLI